VHKEICTKMEQTIVPLFVPLLLNCPFLDTRRQYSTSIGPLKQRLPASECYLVFFEVLPFTDLLLTGATGLQGVVLG